MKRTIILPFIVYIVLFMCIPFIRWGLHDTPPSPPLAMDTKTITFKNHPPFTVEIAKTPEQQAYGLMYRKHLAPYHGMLFIFTDDLIHPMWMKNTFISLNMIFLDQNNCIISIKENLSPLSTDIITPPKNTKKIIEIQHDAHQKYALREHMCAQIF